MLSKWVGGGGGAYFDAVWEAVTSARAQGQFRRHPAYNTILEHVTKEEGDRYLAALTNQDLREICLASAEADTVGNPVTFTYEGAVISPTTLRYGKVAQDLVNAFPRFSSFRHYAEIGVGYGGQARVISEYCRKNRSQLETMTLIDMLPVALLTQSYLDNFDMYATCRFPTKSQLPRDMHYDFVMSNYAFAEFERVLQDEYINNVILRSRNGYLAMNTGFPGKTEWHQGAFGIRELLERLPNAVIIRDEPVTVSTNYIIVFGEHSLGAGLPVDEFLASL